MSPVGFPMGLGPLGSPPGVLVALALVAVVLLVGRVLLHLAWKLVIVGILVVTALWVLGAFGLSPGVLDMTFPVVG